MARRLSGDRHLVKRAVRKQHGFTWGREARPELQPRAISYRLFIRDSAGVCHGEIRLFPAEELARSMLGERRHLAMVLRGMRAQLRWRVDQLEFARLGLEDPTPAPTVQA